MAKDGFKVMDSDIHAIEPPDMWQRYLEPEFRGRGPRPASADAVVGGMIPLTEQGETKLYGDGSIVVTEGALTTGYQELPVRQQQAQIRRDLADERATESGRTALTGTAAGGGSDPKAMLSAMEVEGVDVSIVFRTFGAHVLAFDADDGMDGPLSAAICRAHNNWMRDYCDEDPQRLKMSALVPVHDVDEAVKEASRVVSQLGAVVLVLPNQSVNKRPWYDEYYHPLWAEAERLGVPVAFHGIQMARQQHLGRRYMDNFALAHAAAHPVELMLCLGSMLTGGVFEKFPNLKGAFLEGHCSWVPWWLYCLDEHYEKFGDSERFGLTMNPSDYFRRQCWVSVDPDEELLTYTIQAMGDDNMVISTDWPHDDSGYPHCMDTFMSLPGVPDESKRKILWDNCARLYNLG